MSTGVLIALVVAILVLGAIGSLLALRGERTRRESVRDRWQDPRKPWN